MVEKLFEELAALPQVEAIALEGPVQERSLMKNRITMSICIAKERSAKRCELKSCPGIAV